MKILEKIKFIILSSRYERSDEIVVLSSWFGEKYADNTRFLFDYLSNNKTKLGLSNVIWLTWNESVKKELNSMGYESYIMDSEEGIYFQKKAGYQICNNCPIPRNAHKGEFIPQYSYGTKRVNLWHGTGVIKKFGMASNEYKRKLAKHKYLYAIKNYFYRNSYLYRLLFGNDGGWDNCYYLTTSESELVKFRECYPLPQRNYIISGYPRNTHTVKLFDNERHVIDRIKDYSYSILYLPTFRTGDDLFDADELADTLLPILKEKNIVLIQKSHAADTRWNMRRGLNDNVLCLDSDFDVNVLTPIVSLVITDYSSIVGDAIYHRKPVIIYAPDYDQYVNGDRGITSDAKYILSAGKIFYEKNKLADALYQNDDFEVFKSCDYENVRNRVWSNTERKIEDIWLDICEKFL